MSCGNPIPGLISFVLIFLNFSISVEGQNSPIYFEQTYGGVGIDVGRFVEKTSDGGFILAGYHTEINDTTSNIWLSKVDHSGDTLWTASWGSTWFDAAYCVRETYDKHFVICGVWKDFNDTDPNDFAGDIFVSLLNPEGDVQWTWLYADGNNNLGGGANYILEDDDGNFVLTGGMRSYGYHKKHSFLLKLNRADQTVIWEHLFPPEDYVSYTTTVLKTPGDNGFIITGLVYPPDHNGCDVMLVKTNSVGDTLWTNLIGEWGDYEARHMAACSDGGYIITGNTGLPPDFTREAYLLKVNENGEYLWHRHFPSGYPNIPTAAFGVLETNDEGFALTGYYPFTETVSQDLVLIKTGPDGELAWMRGYGGQNYDKGYGINSTEQGFVLIGFKEQNQDNRDVYLIHTDSLGIVTSQNEIINPDSKYQPPLVYPNPVNEILYIDLNNQLENLSIKIRDIRGMKIQSIQPGANSTIQIDIQYLPAGIYILEIRTNQSTSFTKILKQ